MLNNICTDLGEKIISIEFLKEITKNKKLENFDGFFKFINIETLQPSVSFLYENKRYNVELNLVLESK